MKILFVILAVTSSGISQSIAADATNDFVDSIIQAQTSGDEKPIISALPDAETLWCDHPDQYFESMKNASHILEGVSPTNAEAREALVVIFTNTLLKPFPMDAYPTNSGLAAKCIELQVGTAWTCSDVMKKTDKNTYALLLAHSIGEVRSHIISHYKPKGRLLNGPDFSAQERAQNQEYMNEDHLQNMLHDENNSLTFLLLHSDLLLTNLDFIGQISNAALLTDEERSKLQ